MNRRANERKRNKSNNFCLNIIRERERERFDGGLLMPREGSQGSFKECHYLYSTKPPVTPSTFLRLTKLFSEEKNDYIMLFFCFCWLTAAASYLIQFSLIGEKILGEKKQFKKSF